ncbi:uncharacterized protein LOC110022724 [Phalaenopsis equestris]|uniref:uncharacterized protein LOC110022724 n=1 Tax=Phalaenopsis equestris TaxID=78828 RepID=UPI0009E46CDB|nr:uncharacterized protein LOC110022724 [Phalaenopsis equestris]
MAGHANADQHHRLSVDTPTPPISKDVQVSDSSIPLSPQWLLPKPGDNRLGLAARETHPHLGKNTDPPKALGNVEDHLTSEKRKDVYRPSFHDTERGRRDRWGDEEREANSVIRRDFQREGEELGDSRKSDRWSNTASKYSGEARRFDRWADSMSRESAYEPRRESKWNTRWGPDDKESERRHEKWSVKDVESSHDKGAYHPPIHAKDMNNQGKDTDKEGEHHRLWRTSVVNRGKGETNPYLPSTKPVPMFGHGRGKGDNGGLSASNVSGDSARHFPLGTASDSSNGGHIDHHILRYSRMKLLDICRMTDLKGYRMSHEWFREFPSLMQADPLMPLSLTAPTAEELFMLEAIDKGDILSSGVPLASKEGLGRKNSVDSASLLSAKPGIEEDAAPALSDHRDEITGHRTKDQSCYAESALYNNCLLGFDLKPPSGESFCQSKDVSTAEAFKFEIPPNKAFDPTKREASKAENTIPCISHPFGVGALRPSNYLHSLTEDRSGPADMDRLNTRKEMLIEPSNRCVDSSSSLRGDSQSDVRAESWIRRQPSETIEGEGFTHLHSQGNPFILRDKLADRKLHQFPSPELLSLFYKDPQGQVQGPFSGTNLIEWFDAGYFGIDLQVRLANAPADTPFSLLGDVIPQLRTRVRPPPGFGSARPNDIVEVSNKGKFGGPSGIHAGIADFELMKNGGVLRNESKVRAENQFLESLMSARISSSVPDNYTLSEAMQKYNGLAGGRPSLGIENMNDIMHLPQKMPLEQPSPLPSPYRPGRESPAILSKPDAIGEFPIPPKILPQLGEVPHHIPQSLQHVDLLSIFQSVADKTPPPAINSASSQWPSFPEVQALRSTHASIDITKDSFDPNQQNSQSVFGSLPNRLQPQFPPPLSNQNPVASHPASEFSQDAQMAHMVRQQYMLLAQQMHSQVPLNQMELLLLMQRQQQEQLQNQLLMQQQQQHFLSHPQSVYNSYKNNNEPTLSPPSTEVFHENASLKSSSVQLPEVAACGSRPMHVLDSNHSHAHKTFVQGEGTADIIEHSLLNLPNQFINMVPHSNKMDPSPLDIGSTKTANIVSAVEGRALETSVPQLHSMDAAISEVSDKLAQINEVSDTSLPEKGERILDSKLSVSEMIDEVKISPGSISELIDGMEISPGAISDQFRGEAPELKGVEDAQQCEVKKISEKKSRKHKNSHLRAAAECSKGSVKAAFGQKSKTNSEIGGVEKGLGMDAAEPLHKTTLEAGGEGCASSLIESLESHVGLSQSGALDMKTEEDETKVKDGDLVSPSSKNQAWKPVPGQKRTKPLSEIQVEEQRRAQIHSFGADNIAEIVPTNVSPAPLADSLIISDLKNTVDAAPCDNLGQSIFENRQNPWNLRNISQLPDVLNKEALPKVSVEEKGTSSHPLPEIKASVDNDDFIEAKETRKSRKKAMKNKGVAVKASLPNNSAVVSDSTITTEQTKAARQIQQDKDLLPSPPSAPSLGDFLFWKGDQASTVPSPAWSTDSIKLQKPSVLRDIFKEQDKKKIKPGKQQTSIPTPTKVQPSMGTVGSSSSASLPDPSPSKASAPINSNPTAPTQTSSLGSGQHKTGMEDDFFWGNLNESKDVSRSDFPSLANNPSSQNVKGTPVKGVQGEGSSKKASSSKPVEHSITSLPAISKSFSKGKKNTESKYSEAMDFRNWCEGEWFRLTGTNDTSFLEFCLKQTTTEAASLLRENLVSLDHNHEFIDKFINHKEFLSSEIIEIAFQSRKSSKTGGETQPQASRIQRNVEVEANDGVDGTNKGKKKGKKGKKLNPALLGFNVVSSRIMMGEIQAIED